MFGQYINNLIEYIKKTYFFIYNNYNYKQIVLILAVFVTIYIVELLNTHNTIILQFLPMPPGLPPGVQSNNMVSPALLSSKATKSSLKKNKSNKRNK